jgi:hypothetical protein
MHVYNKENLNTPNRAKKNEFPSPSNEKTIFLFSENEFPKQKMNPPKKQFTIKL